MMNIPDSRLEPVSRAICLAQEENPDHAGDAQGNEFRWQDYLPVAEKAIEACDRCDKEAKDFFAPNSYEQIAEGIEVGYDLIGGADIRIGGEFNYVRINYHGLYTSNAAQKHLVNEIVGILNGGSVISLKEKKQFDEFKELSIAISMDLPIWPNNWSQDVAALAFFINGLKEKTKAQPPLCPASAGGNIDPDFEDALDRIRKWPISENYQPLFDHIISNVWKHNFGKATVSDDEYEQIEYTFATGGWSENEEILAALKEQRLAWSLTWLMSERGGRHVFRIITKK